MEKLYGCMIIFKEGIDTHKAIVVGKNGKLTDIIEVGALWSTKCNKDAHLQIVISLQRFKSY